MKPIGRPTTTSFIYDVTSVTDGRGDTHFYRGREPRKPRELPDILKEPVPFNVLAWARNWIEASENIVSEMEFDANLRALLEKHMDQRWEALFSAYEMHGDTRDDWKAFALALAKDNVPGLWIEHIYPRENGPTARTQELARTLVERVETAFSDLQASRTQVKVTLGMALERVLKSWTPDLGKRPSNLDSMRSRYHQCKAQIVESKMSLANLGPDDYKKT